MEHQAVEKSIAEGVDHNGAYLEQLPTHATYIEDGQVKELSPEHRAYLVNRHGTADLDPLPAFGNADPYNFQSWKKHMNLILVAFHAMMSTFTAAAIIPAYEIMAADLGKSVQDISYLTSIQIAILGGAPLFWRPLSNRWGRRPVFLISLIGSLVCNIGCAKSPDYASMAACRALVAFFISPAGAIGSAVVTETFFRRERARYMGIWTIFVTLGVPVAPFLMGFVAQRQSYRWIYWVLTCINAVQLILYIPLGPETRYIRRGVEHRGSTFKQEYLTFGRIDPTPLRIYDFIQPLSMARYLNVLIPTIAYAMIFLFASVLITVEIPQLYGPKFLLDAQQTGLQFVAIIIGTLIGELMGGALSDAWMNRRARKGHPPKNEYRLWLAYPGYLLAIVGLIVFLVQIQNAEQGQWNVVPDVGAAIAAVGNQLVTTVLVTYAVDNHHEEAASVGVFITVVRQCLGFVGPFWFPDMFDNIGIAKSAGLTTALMMACSFFPTTFLQWGASR